MSRKQFVIVYPDRSRENISRAERDQALVSGAIAHLAGLEYRYLGQVQTFHAMADLASLRSRFSPRQCDLGYLPGTFTIERKGRRYFERLEKPDTMALRLATAPA